MNSKYIKHMHIVNVTSVQQVEDLCAHNASCMGFDYPTQRAPGKMFSARISRGYTLAHWPASCDPRYTAQLKGVSMAKENFPNVEKCLLSAPAQLISKLDSRVPVTDTISEDQWAPVVDGVETVVDVEQAIQKQNSPTPGCRCWWVATWTR